MACLGDAFSTVEFFKVVGLSVCPQPRTLARLFVSLRTLSPSQIIANEAGKQGLN